MFQIIHHLSWWIVKGCNQNAMYERITPRKRVKSDWKQVRHLFYLSTYSYVIVLPHTLTLCGKPAAFLYPFTIILHKAHKTETIMMIVMNSGNNLPFSSAQQVLEFVILIAQKSQFNPCVWGRNVTALWGMNNSILFVVILFCIWKAAIYATIVITHIVCLCAKQTCTYWHWNKIRTVSCISFVISHNIIYAILLSVGESQATRSCCIILYVIYE